MSGDVLPGSGDVLPGSHGSAPLRVALLMGGTSEERRVSLASGGEVAGALRERGHEVVVIDPASGVVPAAEESRLAAEAEIRVPPGAEELCVLRRTALGPRIV